MTAPDSRPTPPPPAQPAPPVSDDDVHDAADWDEAAGPRPLRYASKVPASRGFLVGLLVLFVTLGAGILLYTQLMESKISHGGVAAQANAMEVYRAQQRYRQAHGLYAASGAQLLQAGLIEPDLAAAFDAWQNNGDGARGAQPQPKAGYFFRLLQGSPTTPNGYRSVDSAGTPGLVRFAVIARPAAPGTSGEVEYLVLEDGRCFTRTVTANPADPAFGQYSLDGDLPVADLTAQGWQPWWGD